MYKLFVVLLVFSDENKVLRIWGNDDFYKSDILFCLLGGEEGDLFFNIEFC